MEFVGIDRRPDFRSDGDVAFRLANELEGLLVGFTADHEIDVSEVERLKRWLAEAAPFRSVQPFRSLATHLDRALDDGVLTLDECEDLLFAASSLTKRNPHFGRARAGVQRLMGIVAGVTSDGRVTAHEIQRLRSWQSEWQDLRGVWPYDQCLEIVDRMVSSPLDADVWLSLSAQLQALARQFPVAGELDADTGELPPLLVDGICTPNLTIQFEGRTFVFTGDSTRCDRDAIHQIVADRGGNPEPRVTKRTDFLIICTEGSPYWAFSCYGRKVERARDLHLSGHHIQIGLEDRFWEATGHPAQ